MHGTSKDSHELGCVQTEKNLGHIKVCRRCPNGPYPQPPMRGTVMSRRYSIYVFDVAVIVRAETQFEGDQVKVNYVDREEGMMRQEPEKPGSWLVVVVGGRLHDST